MSVQLNIEKIWLRSYDKGVPQSIDYPKATLNNFLDQAADEVPDVTAIIFQDLKISYSELRKLANQFAAGLQTLGVKRGDRVALFLPNCPQFVIAYFGIMQAGGIAVPANPLYVERELSHLLSISGAETIITLDLINFYPKITTIKDKTNLKRIIVTGIEEYLPFPKSVLYPILNKRQKAHIYYDENVIPWKKIIAGKAALSKVNIDYHDVAVVLFSGGTTGVPKGVCLTHFNLVANALQCRSWIPDIREGEEIFLTVLPVFHAFSMTTSLNLPVILKSSMVLLPRFDVQGTLKSIQYYKPTLFMGVPAMFSRIIRHSEINRYNLSSIRFCISGADSLPTDTQIRFEEITGCKLVEGYGLTEASPAVTCNPAYGKRKGIGVPLPDTLCKIVDMSTGETLSPGLEGELCIQGPQVMQAYCNNPEETNKIIKEGWLYTGDIARMDKNGYLEFLGRAKDLIKVQKTGYITAYKVYPGEIEEVLLTHNAVLEAAAIGISDTEQGEKIKVFVVAKPGAKVSAGELIDYCRQYLAEYKIPSEIEFTAQLPKNILGKVLRKELRR